MKIFYACNIQKYGEYGFNPLERHTFKAINMIDARNWIVNHLDTSIKWQIIPARIVHVLN